MNRTFITSILRHRSHSKIILFYQLSSVHSFQFSFSFYPRNFHSHSYFHSHSLLFAEIALQYVLHEHSIRPPDAGNDNVSSDVNVNVSTNLSGDRPELFTQQILVEVQPTLILPRNIVSLTFFLVLPSLSDFPLYSY